jgi:hypothetical protein
VAELDFLRQYRQPEIGGASVIPVAHAGLVGAGLYQLNMQVRRLHRDR